MPLLHTRRCPVALTLIAVLLVSLLGGWVVPLATAANLKLKDISRVKDVRYNQVVGYGLVVGLSDTGDTNRAAQQAQQNLLSHLGARVENVNDLRGKNVAQVMVTALVPPFAKPGDRMDVIVSSMGNAKSLEGGVLISTLLMAPNGEVVAVAQGPISTGGTSASAGGSSVRTAIVTSARVPQGAIIEREIHTELGDGSGLDLVLNRTDFTLASQVASLINSQLAPARAMDGSSIRVQFPANFADNRVAFMAKLENLSINYQATSARVVVNERTGTVVIGNDVRLQPAAVAHGGITVSVQATNTVSQPNSFGQGQTVGVTNTDINVTENAGSLIKLNSNATLNDLVTALNAIGVTPNDLISVLQALKAAGSLEAELEII
jgi:flagellar P-ring protein precursor FlgI